MIFDGSVTLGSAAVNQVQLIATATNPALNPCSIAVNTQTASNGFTFFGAGAIAGAATSLTLTGGGTLVIANSGTNSYGGGTFIQNGTIQLGVSNGLPTGGTVTLGNLSTSGTVDLNGYSQTLTGLTTGGTGSANTITNSNTSGLGASVLTLNGVVATFGGLITNGGGAGSLALQVNGGSLTLTGTNSYTGGTTINAGTLQVAQSGSLGTAPVISLQGGGTLAGITNTVVLPTATISIGTGGGFIAGATAGQTLIVQEAIGSSTNLLTVGGAGNTTIAGNITATTGSVSVIGSGLVNISGNILGTTGGVTMNGTNTLTLGGANTYTGINTINTGTLAVSSDGNLGAVPGGVTPTSITVSGTGTLDITQSTTINPNRGITLGASTTQIVVSSGATVNYGGLIASTTGLTFNSPGGTLVLSGANTFTGGITLSGGTLQVGVGRRRQLNQPGTDAKQRQHLSAEQCRRYDDYSHRRRRQHRFHRGEWRRLHDQHR